MFNISKKRLISPYISLQIFRFSIFIPRAPPSVYRKEVVAYKKLEKKYRMKNIIAYWDRQTKIENDFIGFLYYLKFTEYISK